ncbi:MAG: hypothetical protein IJT41_08145 [Clostridia bacterium]|nr:hypothetical protein [Clostridia bacterium]
MTARKNEKMPQAKPEAIEQKANVIASKAKQSAPPKNVQTRTGGIRIASSQKLLAMTDLFM